MSPIVANTYREAIADHLMPVGSLTLNSGRSASHLQVKRGDIFCIPIAALNRSTIFWGPDAAEFRPERWVEKEQVSPLGKYMPLGGLATFSAGRRMCIGIKFAVCSFALQVQSGKVRNHLLMMRRMPHAVEMKALLSELVDAFEFSPWVVWNRWTFNVVFICSQVLSWLFLDMMRSYSADGSPEIVGRDRLVVGTTSLPSNSSGLPAALTIAANRFGRPSRAERKKGCSCL